MMLPFRCALCGETYLGQTSPERCPFCGSAGKHVIPAAEWINYGKIDMCEQSKKDCEKGLELEINNAAYYHCAAEKAQNQVTQSIFERLMEQELEHAEVFAAALGIEFEEIKKKCYDEDSKNMIASNRHEAMAIKYSFFVQIIN